MIDPSMLDPSVLMAAQKAGLDPSTLVDANINGKIDVQDVALMQAGKAGACQPGTVSIMAA